MTNTYFRVPEVDAMNAMTDQELLAMRAVILGQLAHIEGKIESAVDVDPVWAKKVRGARFIYQGALASSKAILAARWTSEYSVACRQLFLASSALAEDDSEENWESLETALAMFPDWEHRPRIDLRPHDPNTGKRVARQQGEPNGQSGTNPSDA